MTKEDIKKEFNKAIEKGEVHLVFPLVNLQGVMKLYNFESIDQIEDFYKAFEKGESLESYELNKRGKINAQKESN